LVGRFALRSVTGASGLPNSILRERSGTVRNLLAVLAAAGSLVLVIGILYSMTWLIVIGLIALVVSLAMAVLSAPRTRRGR